MIRGIRMLNENEFKDVEEFYSKMNSDGKLSYQIDQNKSTLENKKAILGLLNGEREGYKVDIEVNINPDKKPKKKEAAKSENPFKGVSDKEYSYLLQYAPDSHNFNDAGKDLDFSGLKQYIKDEWGIIVPEMAPQSKKEIKQFQKNQKEQQERLHAEQIRKAIEDLKYKEGEIAREILKSKTAADSVMISRKKEILIEVSRYNPHCEEVTWQTIFFLMGYKKWNTLNLGPGGFGKSRGNLNLIKPKDEDTFCPFKDTFADIIPISGHVTPKRFFNYLKMDLYMIIDESYSIWKNPQIQHLLRSALYDGLVEWSSTKDEGDERHNYKAGVIFNTNQLGKSMNERALIGRTFCNNVELSKDQIISKISQRRVYQPEHEICELIKNRLITCRASRATETPLADIQFDFEI